VSSEREIYERLYRDHGREIGDRAASLMGGVIAAKGSTMLGLEAGRESMLACLGLAAELEREIQSRGKG